MYIRNFISLQALKPHFFSVEDIGIIEVPDLLFLPFLLDQVIQNWFISISKGYVSTYLAFFRDFKKSVEFFQEQYVRDFT